MSDQFSLEIEKINLKNAVVLYSIELLAHKSHPATALLSFTLHCTRFYKHFAVHCKF